MAFTRHPSRSTRRAGFTLVEVALATVIGSIVLLAAMGLLMTLERSERSVSRRAHESAQLQRARLVLQRAFGSILVSSPAPQQRPGTTTAVAVPADSSGSASGKSGSTDVAGGRDTAPGGRDERSSTASRNNSAAGDSKNGGNGQNNNQPLIRAPDDAPPRIILHHDELVSQYIMSIKEADGVYTNEAPQRLEMVLIEPPVPTTQLDPFVVAHNVKLEAKRRGVSRSHPEADDAMAADTGVPNEVTDAAEGDDPDAAASEDWGIRAVRGAFELIPKPQNTRGMTDAQRATVGPLLDEYGNPKAWELWWVPVAPRHTIAEVREMGRARALLEASSYGEPFMIATDIASMRYRMFDDRIRKDTFEATIQHQLPAYVEVDVATVGGLTASWLFEVSWATGPETRPVAENSAASADVLGGRAVESSGSSGSDAKESRQPAGTSPQPDRTRGSQPPSQQPSSTQPPGVRPQAWPVDPDGVPYRVRPSGPIRDKRRGR